MEAKEKPSSTPVRLEVLGQSGDTRVAGEFVKEKIVLGRILSADLRIDDPRVSRIHALVEVRGERILITDLASTHGTFVNGEKVVDHELKFGDRIRLGVVEIKIEKGSGQAVPVPPPSSEFIDSEATQVEIDRSMLDKMDRRDTDRRKQDFFPEERRLDDRRQGERRLEQRKDQRRKTPEEEAVPPTGTDERRSGEDRREPLAYERRVGERRQADRRVFDITSLERRVTERRDRKDDDMLPQELESAFAAPEHARELEVTVLWGDHILDVSNYFDPMVISVGESPLNHYVIPSEGIPDEFPLLTVEEDGNALLAFTDEMSGTVRAREKVYTLRDLQKEKFTRRLGQYYVVPLRKDDFAKVSIGSINFFILYVQPAPRVLPAPLFDRDALLVRTFIGTALLTLLLFIGLIWIPEPKPVTIEMIPERFAKIVIKKKPKIVAPEGPKEMTGGSKLGEGGAPKEPEGKAGEKKETVKKEAEIPKPTPKKVEVVKPSPPKPPQPAKPQKVVDAQKAKTVGLLKAFNTSALKQDVKELLDQESGVEAFGKSLSVMRGKTLDSGGAAGKGLKGVQTGGAGKSIGIDGPSTKGLGAGSEGSGEGEGLYGPGRLGQKGEHSVSIVTENVQVLSGLPKDVINAVVQRHRAEIRHCYEAARQRNPNLRGKIVIAFNIQPTGIVSYTGVKEDTVGDKSLASCMLSRVKTWVFPKPEAPVVTEVSAYPFFLNPGN